MLDEFTIPEPTKSSDTRIDASTIESAHELLGNVDGDEFGKELQKQMAALMGDAHQTPAVKDEMHKLMHEMGLDEASKADENDKSFDSAIRKTMERLDKSQSKEDTVPDDLLAQLMKEMEAGQDGKGLDDENLSQMLVGMMDHLTNKDVLYQPMKDLQDKFPAWLEAHRSTCSPQDLARYDQQQRIVGDIVTRFERSDYSDAKQADREYVVDRMQKVWLGFVVLAADVKDASCRQSARGSF